MNGEVYCAQSEPEDQPTSCTRPPETAETDGSVSELEEAEQPEEAERGEQVESRSSSALEGPFAGLARAGKRRRGYTSERVEAWLTADAHSQIRDETLDWAEANEVAFDWLIAQAERHHRSGAKRVSARLLLEELRYLSGLPVNVVLSKTAFSGMYRWRERYVLRDEMEPVLARLLLRERPEWLEDEFIVLDGRQ